MVMEKQITNELGTALQDIEAKAERKRDVLKLLSEINNIASDYAPDAYYLWLQSADETIRKYIEEN